MNQIITRYKIKLFPALLSFLLLLVAFKIDILPQSNTLTLVFKIIAVPTLAVFSLFITFGKEGLSDIFSKPIKPFKNTFKWYLLSFVASITSGIILTKVLKIYLKPNPGTEHVMQMFISLPFTLLFEEIISFFVLLVIANLVFKKTKNLALSQTMGVIFSCIYFGLLHYSTYFSGNMIHTLLHILFVQGVIRIFFNMAGLKSNSIIVPWIVHVLFDFTTFGIGAAFLSFM